MQIISITQLSKYDHKKTKTVMIKILLIQEKGRYLINQDFRECCCLKRAFENLKQEVDIWGQGWENFLVLPDFNSYDLIINMENYGDTWIPRFIRI